MKRIKSDLVDFVTGSHHEMDLWFLLSEQPGSRILSKHYSDSHQYNSMLCSSNKIIKQLFGHNGGLFKNNNNKLWIYATIFLLIAHTHIVSNSLHHACTSGRTNILSAVHIYVKHISSKSVVIKWNIEWKKTVPHSSAAIQHFHSMY